MKRAALISVSDRTGLVEFARGLQNLGFVLLTTSGSGKALKEAGIESVSIESYTGQKEILDGRVKTLHPKIHAGLLARRDNPQHVAELESNDIMPIDVVAVNLYPFVQNLSGPNVTNPDKMVELVDIGGPTMIRAASKNHRFVLPVIDPSDYPEVLKLLLEKEVPVAFRRKLAAKVFTQIAAYDLAIATYFSNVDGDTVNMSDNFELGPVTGDVLLKQQELRYGENPHQKAAFYNTSRAQGSSSWKQLSGKTLSYNNLLDFDATLRIVRDLKSYTAAIIIKHTNPCGVAVGSSLLEALKSAKKSDPRSHFGGILGFTRPVDAATAADIREDFAEIVLAPAFEPAALELLTKNKNLRLLTVDLERPGLQYEYRPVEGGVLVQERDNKSAPVAQGKVVSKRSPTAEELKELQFAWTICAHVKSNAIVLSKDHTLLATGSGQMSRVDSAELAISKARTHKHDLKGAVAASDAFFPFPDSVEYLLANGVTAIVTPAGAKRDEEVISAVDKAGGALVFMDERHFRH